MDRTALYLYNILRHYIQCISRCRVAEAIIKGLLVVGNRPRRFCPPDPCRSSTTNLLTHSVFGLWARAELLAHMIILLQ